MTRGILESEAVYHVPSERAHLFHCLDSCSTEIEYLDFWASLVGITKPELVLETGTYWGWGTVSIATALLRNGLGELHSIEMNRENLEKAKKLLSNSPSKEKVRLIEAETLDFLTNTDLKFDLAFFDSELDIRMAEFRICLDRGLLSKGDYAVFHDSSKVREMNGIPDPMTKIFWDGFAEIQNDFNFEGVIEFPLSRGLLVVKI